MISYTINRKGILSRSMNSLRTVLSALLIANAIAFCLLLPACLFYRIEASAFHILDTRFICKRSLLRPADSYGSYIVYRTEDDTYGA